MEQRVIELLKRIFEGIEITSDSTQETIDIWDSIHQLSIAFEVEREFGILLEPEEIASLKSVSDIVTLLESKK